MSFQDGVEGCRRIMLFETAPPVPPMPIIIPCVSQTLANASVVGDLATSSTAAQTVNHQGASSVANPASVLTHDEPTSVSQLPASVSAAPPSVSSDVHPTVWSPPGDANFSIAVASESELKAAASTGCTALSSN